MTPDDVHTPTSSYIWTMRAMGIFYIILGVVYFQFPNELFYLINVGPKVLKITEAIPEPIIDRFWLTQSVSLMAVLAAICFLSAESPNKRGFPLLHLLAKVTSAAGFIFAFTSHKSYFAYVVGAAFELGLALIVFWSMVRIGRT